MESLVGPRVLFNGQEVDYFSGTGYLGLQSHPAVIRAAQQALERFGLTTATSRGSYGEHPLYAELEREARKFFAAERILYFASGYFGISILTQATSQQFDHIFIDAQAHYSLWDAAQATNMPITPFHHLRVDRLEQALRQELQPRERPLVLSDGVFPVSGEIAPLSGYLEQVKPYGGRVYLDDAHAVGVLGEHGRGTAEYFGIADDCCRTSGTLAKALGGYGGIIWGEDHWVEHIDRNSRIYAGASPPPLVVTAASAAALTIAESDPGLRQRLWANVARARSGLRGLGWELEDTPVPILCLRAQGEQNLQRMQTQLLRQGIAVTYARDYPSTPPGGALRIAIFANHSFEQIDRLIEALSRLV
jgi:glycine C-acetyltransferase/8-amino-7-oxononanoate synthase